MRPDAKSGLEFLPVFGFHLGGGVLDDVLADELREALLGLGTILPAHHDDLAPLDGVRVTGAPGGEEEAPGELAHQLVAARGPGPEDGVAVFVHSLRGRRAAADEHAREPVLVDGAIVVLDDGEALLVGALLASLEAVFDELAVVVDLIRHVVELGDELLVVGLEGVPHGGHPGVGVLAVPVRDEAVDELLVDRHAVDRRHHVLAEDPGDLGVGHEGCELSQDDLVGVCLFEVITIEVNELVDPVEQNARGMALRVCVVHPVDEVIDRVDHLIGVGVALAIAVLSRDGGEPLHLMEDHLAHGPVEGTLEREVLTRAGALVAEGVPLLVVADEAAVLGQGLCVLELLDGERQRLDLPIAGHGLGVLHDPLEHLFLAFEALDLVVVVRRCGWTTVGVVQLEPDHGGVEVELLLEGELVIIPILIVAVGDFGIGALLTLLARKAALARLLGDLGALGPGPRGRSGLVDLCGSVVPVVTRACRHDGGEEQVQEPGTSESPHGVLLVLSEPNIHQKRLISAISGQLLKSNTVPNGAADGKTDGQLYHKKSVLSIYSSSAQNEDVVC